MTEPMRPDLLRPGIDPLQNREPLGLQTPWTLDSHNLSFEWRRLFAEALGTFFLVLVAAGAVAVNAKSHGQVRDGEHGDEWRDESRIVLVVGVDARWMRAETRSLPKIQIPRNVDSKKKASKASMASGAPNTLPT